MNPYERMMVACDKFDRHPSLDTWRDLVTAHEAAINYHYLMRDEINRCAPPANPEEL